VYAISKYSPLEITFSRAAVPVGVGGLMLGGGLIAWLTSRQARSRRELAARNERAVAAGEAVELEAPKRGLFGSHGLIMTLGIGFGALLLGGGIVLCWCFTANALLDNSKPEFRPVEIVEFWSTSHSFLFREYEIEYRFPAKRRPGSCFPPRPRCANSELNSAWQRFMLAASAGPGSKTLLHSGRRSRASGRTEIVDADIYQVERFRSRGSRRR